jgi:hypothetical protein
MSEVTPPRFTFPRTSQPLPLLSGDDCQNHTSVPPKDQLCPPPIAFFPAGQATEKLKVAVCDCVVDTISYAETPGGPGSPLSPFAPAAPGAPAAPAAPGRPRAPRSWPLMSAAVKDLFLTSAPVIDPFLPASMAPWQTK